MKQRLLILMPAMYIGGAERSLLGLLEVLDQQKYEIDLFLYKHKGEFLKHIPQNVNILPETWQYTNFDVPITSLLFSKRFLFGCSRLLSKLALKIHCKVCQEPSGVWMEMQYISRSLQWLLPSIPGKYDVAISFLGVPDILVNKVNAKVKLAWNHTDYSILNPDRQYDRKIYSKINYVVSVSEPCKEQFLRVYPELKNKAVTIENTLSICLLYKQAMEKINDMPRKEGEILLLSIGRFSDAKNFDNIPEICKRIRELGHNVVWYIIGYGGEERLIRQRIAQFGMDNYVKILGKKDNPYPYIRCCDMYIQPSRYEGKAVTVIEAQALCKPVIITNYATAASQLENGIDGVIVPMDNENCAKGISNVLNNPELAQRLKENCRARDYSNAQEVKKLYTLMKG